MAHPKMVDGQNFYLKQVAPAVRASKIDGLVADVSSIHRVGETSVLHMLACNKRVTDLSVHASF